MARLFRTLVIWALALALPAQGLASATMALCSPDHHRVAIAVSPAGPDASAPTHSEPCHAEGREVLSYVLDAGMTPSAHDGQSGDEVANAHIAADPHGCSACAACCSAATISNDVVTASAATVNGTVFSFLGPTVARAASDGPDRPPRHLLDQ